MLRWPVLAIKKSSNTYSISDRSNKLKYIPPVKTAFNQHVIKGDGWQLLNTLNSYSFNMQQPTIFQFLIVYNSLSIKNMFSLG